MGRLIQYGNDKGIAALMLYNKMAGTGYSQGNYEKALQYYETALSISKKVLGPEHPDTTALYNNIAGVYYALHDYTKALEYFEKALVIRERGPLYSDAVQQYRGTALCPERI